MTFKELLRGQRAVKPVPLPVASSAPKNAQGNDDWDRMNALATSRPFKNEKAAVTPKGKKPHRVAFHHQRAIGIFVVLGLITVGSTFTLWFHYDNIFGDHIVYKWLVRGGLAVVDFIAFLMALWHVYSHYAATKVWCFIAEVAIAAMMIVHAGAVMTLESSGVQQKEAVAAAGDAEAKIVEAQAKVVEAETKARIAAAEKVAQRLEAEGKPNQAAAYRIKAASVSSASKQKPASTAVTTAMEQNKRTTFLSDSYMKGGIYYWPSLFALFFFGVAIAISAFGVAHEVDKNQNGIPDYLEQPGNERLLHGWLIANGYLPPGTPFEGDVPPTNPDGGGGRELPGRRIQPLPPATLPATAQLPPSRSPKA